MRIDTATTIIGVYADPLRASIAYDLALMLRGLPPIIFTGAQYRQAVTPDFMEAALWAMGGRLSLTLHTGSSRGSTTLGYAERVRIGVRTCKSDWLKFLISLDLLQSMTDWWSRGESNP